MNTVIEQLRRLSRFGFHGERLFDHEGEVELLYYTRNSQGVREVVVVHGEYNAMAYRTRDLLDPESPLQISENALEWRLHGDVMTVINALLSLPPPAPSTTATHREVPGASR